MAGDTEKAEAKRPIGVWVIVCIYTLTLLLSIPAIVFSINHKPQIFAQFSAIDILVSGIAGVSIFIAILALFFLRVVSFWILVGVTILSVAYYLGYLVSGQKIPGPENVSMTGKFIELAIWGGFWFMSGALNQKAY